ncbi:MAG: hypothetical protein FVQ82_04340 [Planctomycetes bacterium]|nr:hypothetical protein [Planctomycetota bacterium]
MQRLFTYLAIFTILLMFSSCSPSVEDELFNKFQDPPAEAKPFVRWWWGENSIAEKEILREIDVMDKAGIGGYEINPISLPVKTELSTPSLEWLSPEFNRLVKVAVDETNRRGMIADLIVGSGWPFGAEFLKPGEMTKRFYMNSIEVQGPATFSKSMDELIVPLRHRRSFKDALKPVCRFISMAPADITDIAQSIDITDKIKDGKLTVKVPAGKHIIHVGLIQEGFSQVHNGSPGAMGPVLDHYKASSLQSYLDKMSGKLGPALGGKLGPAVRAIFCDSIELSAANWTTDMPEVFKKHHGYDLLPYLPYIVDSKKPITGQDPWSDRLKRVRYDYCKTLVDMFQERFIKVYHKWCNDNGCLSRYQAYGTPWLMGMLDSYLIPDIPETNNWLYSDPDSHGFLVWTKYCSSAGHIKGRKIISSEAMTNTSGVFKATLDQIKAADDMNFIMGINHSVLHGYTYSPLEEGPYARVRYGAYFSDQNTWWPYFKNWANYNGRLSAVFQASKPVVSLAIMGPRSDIWSQYGLERPPFHEKPWYLPQLWKVFSQCGSNADHVNEPVLQDASAVQGGKLKCGEMTYDALIIADAETMEPKTAEKIRYLASRGVKIVFINKTPLRGPSLNDLGANDSKIKENIDRSMRTSPIVYKVTAPEKTEDWQTTLLEWADKLLSRMEIKRDVKIDTLNTSFYQTRLRDGDRDLFFLVNTDPDNPLSLKAAFNSKGKTAWHWDPETAKRSVYASPVSGPINITLPPHGSMLIVFEPDFSKGKAHPKKRALAGPKTLPETWDCKFVPAQGEPFFDPEFELTDLGKSKDKKLNTFAGVIYYARILNSDNAADNLELDLGTVNGISEVIINGRSIGARWYGQHVYDIGNAIEAGENKLVIKVTTTLYNNLRTKPRTTAAGFWANRGKKSRPVPAGLVGPVTLK